MTFNAQGFADAMLSVLDRFPHVGEMRRTESMVKLEASSAEGGFALWIDPGDAPVPVLVEFMAALDMLHRAYGGSGLTLIVPEAPRD